MKEKYENVKETESRLQLEIEQNGLVNSVLLKLGNGNSVSDKGVETRKPLPTLVTELNDVDNEIVKLNFEVDDLQYFPDVDDITIDQFILHSGPKRHERTFFNKKTPIKKTIIELRNLNNKMKSVDERIEENSMWKPATNV